MIIGFGSIEQKFEDAEEAAFKDFARAKYIGRECDYVTPELVDDVREWVEARAEKSRNDAEAFKDAADFPDRYSSYWATVLNDASHIVVIFRHSHINRRHGFSPDGWALLQTERLACFSSTRDV